MKTPNLFLAMTIVNLILNDVCGETSTNGWTPTGSLFSSLQERYIALRVTRVLYDGLSLQSEITVNLPKGFYVDLWNHAGIGENVVSKQPKEIDMTFGWQEKLPLYGLEVGLSGTFFNNSPLGLWWKNDALAQTATLSKTFVRGNHTLRPQLRVEWISRATDIGGGALILMPNIAHVWKHPFGITPMSTANQMFVIHDDGFDPPKNDSEGYFLRWHSGLRWQLGKRMTLTIPSFIAQIPLRKGNDGRGQATSWGTAMSFSF